jgi:spore germination protein GerM
MGNNGESGKYIGCGDSLVPVEIRIEPTLGVLRAAINELLKLQGQHTYGQSGLYNALYLSDLQLQDVAVIDGVARIAFTGQLIYGGECDIPRIEEQLYTLAMQFTTVDSVVITVNGVALEELLDLRG